MLLALPLSGIVIPTLILIWLVILVVTGYVGLGTIITGVSFPLYLYLFSNQVPELMIFGMLCSILIIFTHRSNIIRMYRGDENQFEKIMILKKILK